MFKKILIANRGEIACRVIRTLKAMGIKSVAVYSDADAVSEHVSQADEAVRIGAPPSSESYLKGDAIIKAAKETGAEAIHPGFGFLSENADFVRAVEKAGLVFIGPGADAITAMGDKITSKTIADKAGVSTIPGTEDAVEDIEEAVRVAKSIGYPLMIKASAGGGGKGMRIARDEAELRVAMPQAQNEAVSSFGDGRVFIEKFVVNPRHIEIQILADRHGNVVYVGERECSLQRRHQKVFEEAPSPFISEKTRKAMGAQAVGLAKAVGYSSAGTVEFIVDKKQNFYFLEMNTRLQVEHPVTEEVYGLDLVEWMIKIAAGERLTLKQSAIKPKAWAIEARLYAEDPKRGFLPSIGRLMRYQEPEGKGIRTDSGIAEGGEISMFYDPMIAKLIGYGKTRSEAIGRLAFALDRYVLHGLEHNRQFLRSVCDNPRFKKGDMTTEFIAEEYPNGHMPEAPKGEALHHMRAVAALLVADKEARQMAIGGGDADKDFILYDSEGESKASVEIANNSGSVRIGKKTYAFDSLPNLASRIFMGNINKKEVAIQYARQEDETLTVMAGASALQVKVLPLRAAEAETLMPIREASNSGTAILAPMPGLLTKLLVEVGDNVAPGDDVAIIEAMKMENLLKADSGGVVDKIMAAEGDRLNVDQEIIRFGSDDKS